MQAAAEMSSDDWRLVSAVLVRLTTETGSAQASRTVLAEVGG